MPQLWTVNALADEFGVDRRTVTKRLADVKPCGKVRGTKGWKLKVAAPHVLGIQESFAESGPNDEKRILYYEAELKKTKLEKERAMSVHVDDMVIVVSELIDIVTSFAETIPDSLERQCGLEPDQVEHVRDNCDAMQRDLYTMVKKYNDA